MDTLQTLRHLLARLAGAPPVHAARPAAQQSGLYQLEGENCSRNDRPREDRPRTARQRDGDDAEALGRRYLECAGLVFVAANVRYRDGEIDLVMRDAGAVPRGQPAFVFVEVRRRARDSHGGAAASVTRAKRRRLVAAASHYLVGLGLRTLPSCRFDVVAVAGDVASGFRVDWIRHAFQDDGS